MPSRFARSPWFAPLVSLLLTLAVVLIYAQVRSHSFLGYDDDLYITANGQIKDGLTLRGLVWAFTSIHESNWIPLTWLSHMADVQLFGLAPAGHHLTNVLLHLTNSLLIFWVFSEMTASRWRSALLALLFAVHPLHVESVAWAAERKDLLCGLFFCLTLGCYSRYARQRRLGLYCLAILFFVLGLLAKPMMVIMPLALILLDFWPLARLGKPGPARRQVLAEKIPFLVGSAGLAAMTVIAQTTGGSVVTVDQQPIAARLANAALSYLSYLGKFFLPVRLSVFYPYQEVVAIWQVVVAVALLVALTVIALARARRQPYLAMGWLWFLGTLVPVIGLVQVGEQAMADRYMYLPMIGPLVVVVWGGEELWRRCRLAPTIGLAIALAIIAALALVAERQTRHWQDQYTLFQHAVTVSDRNYLAWFQLANALAQLDRLAEAQECLAKSIAIRPSAKAYNNLAYIQERTGRADQAATSYRQAIGLDPVSSEYHYHLGLLLVRQWQLGQAIDEFSRALELEPTHHKARENLEKAKRMLAAGGDRSAS